jgi:hypothetical protein
MRALRPLPSPTAGLPCCPHHLSSVPCPLPRRIGQVLASIASLSVRPSPFRWRVGIRIFTFEACSGFTRVTARWIAQPPKATFVTRLRPGQLPNRAARQLPDPSTTIWVESSSTGDTRLSGHTAKSGSNQATRTATGTRALNAPRPSSGQRAPRPAAAPATTRPAAARIP